MNTTMNTKQSTKVQVGDWVYHPETLVVRYRKGVIEYEVDLEQCSKSAEMLDSIFQFGKKVWATSESVGDLVKILNRLLYPQENLCSWGKEQGPLPKGNALRKSIDKHIKERQVMHLREQRWKAEHPGSSHVPITLALLSPRDLKELERMEPKAGLR